MTTFEKARIIGKITYKTKSQRKAEALYELGEFEHKKISSLDLEEIKKELLKQYKYHQKRNVEYQIVEMHIQVWTDGYTHTDYYLN